MKRTRKKKVRWASCFKIDFSMPKYPLLRHLRIMIFYNFYHRFHFIIGGLSILVIIIETDCHASAVHIPIASLPPNLVVVK